MRHREDVVGFRHCLIVGKINDFESKKDTCKTNVRSLFESITNDDGVEFLSKVTGLCCIMGSYFQCVIQSEDDLYTRHVLQQLQAQQGKTPYLENAWVLHYQEEISESHFREFTVEQMQTTQANKEIKNWTQFEKVHHIYHAIETLGDQLASGIDAGKNPGQLANLVKQQAIEVLPAGDELTSALEAKDAMSLKEWCDFMGPPDILLEKELCWPVEPELVY